MTAAKYDIILQQGSDEIRTFTLMAPDGVPINLRTCHAHCQVRDKAEGEVLFTPTLELGDWEGWIKWTVAAEQTTGMSFAGLKSQTITENGNTFTGPSAVYDLEVTYGDGTTQRVLQGNIIISPEVTRG